MGRSRRADHESDESALDRLMDVLEGFAPGVHRLGAPALLLDTALPESLAELYRYFDGGELFHETIVLVPSSRVTRESTGGGERCRIGEIAGDDLFVDGQGRVWRLEEDTGEHMEEGSRLDRWLLGAVEAEAMLYDRDGEFKEEVFDEDGEVLATVGERMLRRVLKRDRAALAPRWRLAQMLVRQDKLDQARQQLEEVVALRPDFAWAWFDLARISERLGNLAGALDEAIAAAEANPDYEHTGFFWTQAARLAAAMGDEAGRATYASKALALDPSLIGSRRDGAHASLEAGDGEAALALAEEAAALAPRDLQVCDLLARIREHLAKAPD